MLISKENQDDLQVLRGLVEAGTLRPLIGGTYPLGEAAEAMGALEAGNTRDKLVLTDLSKPGRPPWSSTRSEEPAALFMQPVGQHVAVGRLTP